MKPRKQRKYGCDDLIAAAVDIVEPHDSVEVQEFADRLCGLAGLTADELRSKLVDLEVPGDFRHFLLTNLNTGEPFGGAISSTLAPLDMNEIICVICTVAMRDDVTLYGRGVWTETVALPVTSAGTLELGLRFSPLH